MSTTKNSTTVTIFGTEYTLQPGTDPHSPDIKILAKYVDAKMQSVSERINTVSSTKVAVLTALEIAQELFELQRSTKKQSDYANERLAKLIKTIDETI
ncbi:MAG: cell division protein ZapA [Candidatus Hydrogenedentes bacterium]|nr:cell division protein ZapA [Candidatus Hydrogenedentota bacterium]